MGNPGGSDTKVGWGLGQEKLGQPKWEGRKHCGFTLTSALVRKGMEHVPNIFMSFDKYLFLEVINILI